MSAKRKRSSDAFEEDDDQDGGGGGRLLNKTHVHNDSMNGGSRGREVGDSDSDTEVENPSEADSEVPHGYGALIHTSTTSSGFPIPKVTRLDLMEYRVGRDASQVDILLDSKTLPSFISRVHATLRFVRGSLPGNGVGVEEQAEEEASLGPGVWRILDNNSMNGLFVNDVRVKEANLRDGDVVTFGGKATIAVGMMLSQPDSQFRFLFKAPGTYSARSRQTERVTKRGKVSTDDANEQLKVAVLQSAVEAKARAEAEALAREEAARALAVESERRLAELQKELEAVKVAAEAYQAENRVKEEEYASLQAEKERLNSKLAEEEEARLRAQQESERIALENTVIKKQVKTWDSLKEEYRCSICYLIIVQCHTLSCGHRFCYDCICHWRAQPNGKNCPGCREPIAHSYTDFQSDQVIEMLILNDATDDDKKEYLERKEAKAQELQSVKDLEKQIEVAKGKGKTFLNIRTAWIPKDKLTFSNGIKKYRGVAREKYCELTGLTAGLVESASPQLLTTMAANVGLATAPTTSPADYRHRLKMYILAAPEAS